MNILDSIMWPIKWVIELVLVGWHWLWTSAVGLPSASGVAWALSIVGLVLVVRAALIPLFVKQIRSQRVSLELAPKMRALQQKYKGKRDQASRQAMAEEQMALYKEAGTNPLAGCLPILVQMPIFFGLFSVLNSSSHGQAGVGLLNAELASDFSEAHIFGAKLATTLMSAINESPVQWPVVGLAAALVVFMVGSQLYTSVQIMGKNISAEAKESPMFRQQKMLMYGMPFIMVFSGVAFPIGVLLYWFVSNLWTMVQQFIVIRNMPTPGSEAYFERQRRLAAKGKLTDAEQAQLEKIEGRPQGQRQQPVGKNRAKKQGSSGAAPADQRAESSSSSAEAAQEAASGDTAPKRPQGKGSNTSRKNRKGK